LFELDPITFDHKYQVRLGSICFQNELFFQAAQLYEWARDRGPVDALALYQAGISLRRLGDMYTAEQRLLECAKDRPDIAAPNLQLGHVYKSTGHRDRAEFYYKKYIALSPDEKGTGYWCLADLKSYVFSDEEISSMKDELELMKDKPEQSSALNFALGWAAEQKNDYSAALDYYNEGNATQAQLKPFNARQYDQIVSGLETVAGEDKPDREPELPIPILIVGLPRSGTTLIEQILSAHSRVQATDELPFLERIALYLEMNGGYPQRLAHLSEQERRFLRQQYLNGVRTYLKEESDYFIDKYPGNFLHIGLIKRIMPEAIIIDARRDPRDTAISAYRQLFNSRGEFTFSFDGIHKYYEGYLRMIRHWQNAYPDQIRTQHYEQLVTSSREEIQALLDFCRLESEETCFEFHKQNRAVTTPSASQVIQPMYSTSIAQWQRYEEYAPEEMALLGSLIES
jgi:tetratricopeptide (TPR) repeat protein